MTSRGNCFFLLLVVVVVIVVVVVVVLALQFFLNLVVAENRRIGGVFVFFETCVAKKRGKYPCCLRLGKTKIAVFTMFCASGGKNHGTY